MTAGASLLQDRASGHPCGSLETGRWSLWGPGRWQPPCHLEIQPDQTQSLLPGEGAELQEATECEPLTLSHRLEHWAEHCKGAFPFHRGEG